MPTAKKRNKHAVLATQPSKVALPPPITAPDSASKDAAKASASSSETGLGDGMTELNESFTTMNRSQVQVEATILEMKQYLRKLQAERWYVDHGRVWLEDGGPRSVRTSVDAEQPVHPPIDQQKTTEPAQKTSPSKPQKAKSAGCGTRCPKPQTVRLEPLESDMLAVEHLLSEFVEDLGKNWSRRAGDEQELMSTMYGICTVLRSRIGFNNKLLGHGLHRELVDPFCETLSCLVEAAPEVWRQVLSMSDPE